MPTGVGAWIYTADFFLAESVAYEAFPVHKLTPASALKEDAHRMKYHHLSLPIIACSPIELVI